MSGKGSDEDRRIAAGEDFDSGHPMAGLMRDLAPESPVMRKEARDSMIERLLLIQRGVERPGKYRPRRRWALALVPAAAVALGVIIAVVLVLLPGEAPEPRKYFATVATQSGIVEVSSNGTEWRPSVPGERIAPGSRVRTQADSVAAVLFPDGSAMRVTDGSEALVDDIGAKSVKLEHISGGTYHRVEKGTDYVVTNSGVSSRALGTAFNVENRVAGSLEIITLESAVEVEIAKHKPITVVEGEVLVVDLSGEKKADKQPVSRERLQEGRLLSSAQQDAREGNDPGIYAELDVPLDEEPSPDEPPVEKELNIELGGDAAETGVSLAWGVSGDHEFDRLVLLRAETTEPVYPGNEIARYSDISISTARDNSALPGVTYQYRVAALLQGELVAYSNTIVVTMPVQEEPEQASVTLVLSLSEGVVFLEWSVTGAEIFEGYLLERMVTGAPEGSSTPVGTSEIERFYTTDILYSYTDSTVKPGHDYTYRVGLVVDGTVMVYSGQRSIGVPE